jgi:DNA repair protein RadC
LRAGCPGEDAVALSSRLLVQHGGLVGLGKATDSELIEFRGMGQAKAAAVQAALELGRRLLLDTGEERIRVNAPGDIGQRLVLEMGDLEYECMRVVLLNTKNLVLAMPVVYMGCVNQIPIRACELFRQAVRQNATAIIVAHNHPSGDPTPSPEDRWTLNFWITS